MTLKPQFVPTDVLITSLRDKFWEDVQNILKGYSSYQLHHIKNVEEVMNPQQLMAPILALVDGHGGTLATSEWVQSVKMTYPDCPLIVLYGPEDALDFSILKKNGANYIMHTNYDREFVTDMVLQLAPVDLFGNDLPASALFAIDLRDVNPEEAINFDIYVHLPSNEKSFKVRKEGGTIDSRLFDKSNSTHQRLYIKKTQMKEFFEYARTIHSMKDVPDSSPMTEKVFKSKKLIHEIISEFLDAEMSDFQKGKVIYDRCREILTELEIIKEKNADERVREIYRFVGHSRSTYQDAIGLAVFASNFAALLGMSAEQIENAALAGLLHNVGLAQMPASANGKTPQNLSPEETDEYKLYPDRSVILIKSKKVPLPAEASNAIVQHQENADGSGFPHGLETARMDPLGKVMRLAMRFLELTALDGEQLGMTPKAAITSIRTDAISGKAYVDLVTVTQVFKKLGT
ncbi:HD-GYP domain-containing protein [Bdellovibrio sp. HCB337]|uniref:HD-GYP domain-containing protein n=1 Tax=Bdellovibrio sp. HCB337 TaxID=3394358 RepID=UPI0039A4ED64